MTIINFKTKANIFSFFNVEQVSETQSQLHTVLFAFSKLAKHFESSQFNLLHTNILTLLESIKVLPYRNVCSLDKEKIPFVVLAKLHDYFSCKEVELCDQIVICKLLLAYYASFFQLLIKFETHYIDEDPLNDGDDLNRTAGRFTKLLSVAPQSLLVHRNDDALKGIIIPFRRELAFIELQKYISLTHNFFSSSLGDFSPSKQRKILGHIFSMTIWFSEVLIGQILTLPDGPDTTEFNLPTGAFRYVRNIFVHFPDQPFGMSRMEDTFIANEVNLYRPLLDILLHLMRVTVAQYHTVDGMENTIGLQQLALTKPKVIEYCQTLKDELKLPTIRTEPKPNTLITLIEKLDELVQQLNQLLTDLSDLHEEDGHDEARELRVKELSWQFECVGETIGVLLGKNGHAPLISLISVDNTHFQALVGDNRLVVLSYLLNYILDYRNKSLHQHVYDHFDSMVALTQGMKGVLLSTINVLRECVIEEMAQQHVSLTEFGIRC